MEQSDSITLNPKSAFRNRIRLSNKKLKGISMNEMAELRAMLYKYISKLVDYPYDDDVRKMDDYLSYMIQSAEQLEEKSEIYKDISRTAGNSRKILKDIERLGVDHFQAEYVSTFELGHPKAPCPLYEREYSRQAGAEKDLETLNEITQFYFQYGADIENETADFLPVELEFVSFLITRGEEEGAPEKYQKAQLDFIENHLSWLNNLYQQVKDRCKLIGYVCLIGMTDNFVRKDYQFLKQRTLT